MRVSENIVPPVSESWRRIDAWLAAYAPASLALLNPPVTEDALQSAQRAVGVELPAELVESLRCHDGLSRWSHLLPVKPPLSAAEIADHWEDSMDIAEGLEEDTGKDEPWWHPLWIPWAESNGDAQVIDLRPGAGNGRVGMAYHDGSGDFSDAWPSLAAYLHAVVEALYSGEDVRGDYPLLTPAGELFWDLGAHGEYVPAPVGLP